MLNLDAYPNLTDNGWSNPREADFAERRAYLLASDEDINRARKWLRQFERTATVRPWACSYHLKHLCERETGAYISNGALIAAALLEGLKMRHDHGPNCEFNLKKRRPY